MKNDAGILNIIEKDYHEFNSKVKQYLKLLFVLENSNLSPVDKVNKHLYQEVIRHFILGERYTPSQIKDVFSNYEHLKIPAKHITQFFKMLFVTQRDNKGQYKIIGYMSLKEFCRQRDTSPLL